MADQEITDLQVLSSLALNDLLFVRDVSDGIDKQATAQTLLTLAAALLTIPASIDDLNDVDTTTSLPGAGDVLTWDGVSQWVPGAGSIGLHAPTHESATIGGTDEIDGDVLDIDYVPVNYVSTPQLPTLAPTAACLTAHLAGLDTALTTFAPTVHTHVEADITDLQSYVLPADSIDILADVDTTTSTPSVNDVLTWDGSNWVPAAATGAEVNDLTTAVTWANVPDANITQTSVTQHEAALTITESQISDLQAYLLNINSEILDDLQNVSYAGAAAGEILVANGSGGWLNQTIAAAGIAAAVHTHVEADITDLQAYLLPTDSIDILADVDTTTVAPISGDHLEWNGTNWVPAVPGHTVEANDLTAAVVWANVPDANITQSSVVQHEAALTITESQISDLQAYVLPTDSIDILADVDTTTLAPSTSDVLSWNGTNWVPTAVGAPGAHASTHISLGSDEIDGDVLDIDYVPTNYTRSTAPAEVTTVVELTAHLAGIDLALATFLTA